MLRGDGVEVVGNLLGAGSSGEQRENMREVRLVLGASLGSLGDADGVLEVVEHLVNAAVKLHLIGWKFLAHGRKRSVA